MDVHDLQSGSEGKMTPATNAGYDHLRRALLWHQLTPARSPQLIVHVATAQEDGEEAYTALYAVPPALAAPRARRGSLARAARRRAARLWLVLDRRLRRGEGSASGGPWGDGRGAGSWERHVRAKQRSTGSPQPTTSRVVSGGTWAPSRWVSGLKSAVVILFRTHGDTELTQQTRCVR
jgi:hypothetical protein